MKLPHRLKHSSYTPDNDNAGGFARDPYEQAAGVPCFYQPAPSLDSSPVLKAEIEAELGKIFLEDGGVWADIAIGHFVEVTGVNNVFRVVGRKDLCGLNRWYRLDIVEETSGEITP